MSQIQEQMREKPMQFAVGTWIAMTVLRAVVSSYVPKRKIRKAIKKIPKPAWIGAGVLAAAAITAYILSRSKETAVAQVPDVQVTLF